MLYVIIPFQSFLHLPTSRISESAAKEIISFNMLLEFMTLRNQSMSDESVLVC